MIKHNRLLVFALYLLLFSADASEYRSQNERHNQLSMKAAECLAAKELVKIKYGSGPMVMTQVLEETENSWVFVFEPKDQIPRPGSDVIVEVSKKNGSVIIYPGK